MSTNYEAEIGSTLRFGRKFQIALLAIPVIGVVVLFALPAGLRPQGFDNDVLYPLAAAFGLVSLTNVVGAHYSARRVVRSGGGRGQSVALVVRGAISLRASFLSVISVYGVVMGVIGDWTLSLPFLAAGAAVLIGFLPNRGYVEGLFEIASQGTRGQLSPQ